TGAEISLAGNENHRNRHSDFQGGVHGPRIGLICFLMQQSPFLPRHSSVLAAFRTCSSVAFMNVSFIGLGSMGAPMASNLIKAGHQVSLYNRTSRKAEPLKQLGATVASSAAEAAAANEVLITMLADDTAVEQTLFEPGNALAAL